MRTIRFLGLVLLLVACSGQAVDDASYILSEFSIEGPNSLTADGAGTMRVSNSGEYNHTLVVTTDTGEVVGATGLVNPDAAATLQLDLEAGVYSFSCRIVAEDSEGNLVDHYELGMYRTVTVEG